MQLEKVTNKRKPEPRRGYEDACGLAHALELIGERWNPLILRELALGPRRFSELRADLPGISANILTQRLGELEGRGLVRRRKLPPPASVQVYEASEWALEAAPLLCALGRWASRSPLHNKHHPISPVAIMLSMQTNFDPDLASGFSGLLIFRFGPSSYNARVSQGRIEVGSGEPERADVIVEAAPSELGAVLYGGAPLEMLTLQGNVETARRYFGTFTLPPSLASSLVEAATPMP